ncbi:hypothetical protein GCM10010182_42760 [Actinomadura cremea]|nr:hypothetical protein GCM10010182_42760 [Actinomadura cremea]
MDLAIRSYHEYVDPVPALRMVFNVGAESNLAAWWNSTLLLAVAGMAVLAAMLTGPSARPGRPTWLALAAATAWLSIDESVQVHERLAGVGKEWADGLGVSVPTYAWVLPGAAMALAGTVAAVLRARRLPRDQRAGLLGALAVYISGALVVEGLQRMGAPAGGRRGLRGRHEPRGGDGDGRVPAGPRRPRPHRGLRARPRVGPRRGAPALTPSMRAG